MKKTIILLCMATFLISCNKNKKPDYRYRLIGYIYSSQDSTPFPNTQFKCYDVYHTLSGKKEVQETFFNTDINGHFDFISTHQGVLTWPAYFDGAAYVGPPDFGVSKSFYTDETNRIYASQFDTIYSTPYH